MSEIVRHSAWDWHVRVTRAFHKKFIVCGVRILSTRTIPESLKLLARYEDLIPARIGQVQPSALESRPLDLAEPEKNVKCGTQERV